MSKADPKHGRWILPLVIAGLIGFTYLFVNALPSAPVDPTDTTTGGATATGDGGTPATTSAEGDVTTTTLPAEAAAFLTSVDDYAARTAALAEEAQTINDDWDNDAAEFGATRDALVDLQNRTDALGAEINATEVPQAANTAWAGVIGAAADFSTAAADMVDGLVNQPGSESRLAALDAYKSAAATLATTFEESRSAVGS